MSAKHLKLVVTWRYPYSVLRGGGQNLGQLSRQWDIRFTLECDNDLKHRQSQEYSAVARGQASECP